MVNLLMNIRKMYYDAKKSNIDKWLDSFANIGKVFNPDTGKVE